MATATLRRLSAPVESPSFRDQVRTDPTTEPHALLLCGVPLRAAYAGWRMFERIMGDSVRVVLCRDGQNEYSLFAVNLPGKQFSREALEQIVRGAMAIAWVHLAEHQYRQDKRLRRVARICGVPSK